MHKWFNGSKIVRPRGPWYKPPKKIGGGVEKGEFYLGWDRKFKKLGNREIFQSNFEFWKHSAIFISANRYLSAYLQICLGVNWQNLQKSPHPKWLVLNWVKIDFEYLLLYNGVKFILILSSFLASSSNSFVIDLPFKKFFVSDEFKRNT